MKFLLVALLASLTICHAADDDEKSAAEYLKKLNAELAKRTNLRVEADWAYYSNITDDNLRKKTKLAADIAKYKKEIVKDFKRFNWRSYQSDDLKRQFKLLSNLGYAALNEKDYAEILNTTSSMEANFANVRVCDYKNKTKCDLSLDPEIVEVIAKSRDPEELKYYWREFYDKAGTPTRADFERYVELNTKAAKLNGFNSGAEAWLDKYEDPSIAQQLENIFGNDIKHLYQELHGYVRHRLREYHGNDVVSKTGPIPMQLLGNLWGQDWSNIADIVAPFPNKKSTDITNEMVKQGYTPKKMFQMADKLFTSMGLKPAPQNFWLKSILEKPTDGRRMACHASAWDFQRKDDFRIMQCTRVTQGDLFTAHHEMGHIQYMKQYQDQPFVFRAGANPGFHEAIGDVLSLSVSTPKYLERVKLITNYVRDYEAVIQQLMLIALHKVVFLPFAFTMDKYRWKWFSGEVDKAASNCAFWAMREEYSGIEPPVPRSESDFDAPAKFHISADVEYMRYLVALILQFQFYLSACIKAGQYNSSDPNLPLDNCDIYDSKSAGKSLADMMSMGASKPWPHALHALNGERTMTGKAFAMYFEPLYVWLKAWNKMHKVHIGWTKSDSMAYQRKSYAEENVPPSALV